ncbi:uncharacterized protein LOC131842001 [Achroia grisella]|uniref:uncharacterized protein LOC131842001 n=1 Tax=Achroia grisella TaxID=688607 RepID=UPI0027D3123C|nr:uncharacterized protein LOC131842001 [Achroia grisella]
MSKFLDVAVECIREIVDNNRCGVCDKSNGLRQRYTCGFSVCETCASEVQECIQCMTITNSTPCKSSVPDKHLSQKVENISQLLNVFQEIFNTDVYRRHRISEQLKVEKEVFPKCIQAPIKYYNKQKSINTSLNNKENRRQTVYRGETISYKRKFKMDKTQYIEKWFQDNQINSLRKPLSDLNIKNQNVSNEVYKLNNNVNITLREDKLKSQNKKTNLSSNLKSKEKYIITENKSRSTNVISKHKPKVRKGTVNKVLNKSKKLISDNLNRYDNDESGIVMDYDYFIIEDTPTEIIDKDKVALQAVEDSEKQEQSHYIPELKSINIKNVTEINKHLSNCSHFIYKKNDGSVNVPFIKKGLFFESCMFCRYDLNKTDARNRNSNNFSIHIDNDNFVVDVKVSRIEHTINIKDSIAVQTDISEIVQINNDVLGITDKKLCRKSQDLFIDEPNKFDRGTAYRHETTPLEEKFNSSEYKNKPLIPEKKSLIIEESDSDLDVDSKYISLDVTAEVHRSCEPRDYGILTEIPPNDSNIRKRCAERGTTPGSTDSSDKENYDPNRNKRHKYRKKDLKKKY